MRINAGSPLLELVIQIANVACRFPNTIIHLGRIMLNGNAFGQFTDMPSSQSLDFMRPTLAGLQQIENVVGEVRQPDIRANLRRRLRDNPPDLVNRQIIRRL